MKRTSIALLCLLAALALPLGGCSQIMNLITGGSGDTTTQSTLAEKVVTEFMQELRASATSSRAIARAVSVQLSAAQISLIETRATSAVQSFVTSKSTKLDLIIPAMLNGVQQAVTTIGTSGGAAVMAVAARSVVVSVGQPDRTAYFSAGESVEKVIADSTAKALDAVAAVVTDVTVVAAIKAEVVAEAVGAIAFSETVKPKVDAVVKAMAAAVAETEAATPETFEAVITEMSKAAVSLNVTTKTSLPAYIAEEATKKVAAVVAASDAGDLYIRIAASVTTGAGTIGTANLGTVIISAATAGGGDASSVEVEITKTLTETKPVAVATAKIGTAAAADSVTVSTIGTKVYLVTEGSTVDNQAQSVDVDYSWKCVLGDGPVPTSDTSGTYVSIAKAGTYVYELKVSNVGGTKYATDLATIVSTITAASGPATVARGIQYLESQNFDLARAEFTNVLLADAGNADAKLYKALLDLASVSVDTNVVTMMKDRIGFAGYPSTMNSLFSKAWFTDQWYKSKDGLLKIGTIAQASSGGQWEYYCRGTFTAAATDDYSIDTYAQIYNYDSYGNLVYVYKKGSWSYNDTGSDYLRFHKNDSGAFEVDGNQNFANAFGTPPSTTYAYYEVEGLTDFTRPFGLMPKISAPTWAATLIKYQSKSIDAFPFYVLANLIDRNPDGVNAIVDAVLAGAFGANFDEVVAAVKGLPDNVEVTIPTSLIGAYSGGSLPPFAIVIDKPVLTALAGQLQLMKGLFQFVASYDLSLPLSSLKMDILGDVAQTTSADVDGDDLPDAAENAMAAVPGGLVGTNLLKNRSQITRDGARTSFVDGLTDLIAAANAISAKLATGGYSNYLPDVTDDLTTPDKNEAATSEQRQSAIAAMIDMYLPLTNGLVDAIGDSTKSFTLQIPGPDSTTMSIVCYPGKIFDSAVFDFRNFLVMDGKSKIKLFLVKGELAIDEMKHEASLNATEVDETSDISILTVPSSVYIGYAMQLNVAKLAEIWPDFDTFSEPSLAGKHGFILTARASTKVNRTWDSTQNMDVYTYTKSDFDPNGPDVRTTRWACGYGFAK